MAEVNVENMEDNATLFMSKMGFSHDEAGLDMTDEFGLPAWLRQYASGVSINQLLEKVVIEGKEYFKTPDGKYIEPSELAGTVDLGVEEVPA